MSSTAISYWLLLAGDEAATAPATYALQGDEDDDMAVVSNEEQAQAAQVSKALVLARFIMHHAVHLCYTH